MVLYIEEEVHNITILNNIFFSFDTHFTGLFNRSLRTIFNVIVILYNLSTNETFLKVGVNNTCTLGSFPSLAESPRSQSSYRDFISRGAEKSSLTESP